MAETSILSDVHIEDGSLKRESNADTDQISSSLLKDSIVIDPPESHHSVSESPCATFALDLGTACVIIILRLIPICSLIIGGMHLDDCPINNHIPIWLVVTAAVILLKGSFNEIKYLRQYASKITCAFLLAPLYLVALIWILFGSNWVISVYSKVQYDPDITETYCSQLLYIWSFTLIMSSYLLIVTTFCCYCVVIHVRRHHQ